MDAAFGTHNVRSIAHALAQAERLGIDHRSFEFQMLYGMADPIKQSVLQLGCRLREYCPVGELLPGMAYLVRRLLENTSNEGFLANRFAKGASRDQLLKNPAALAVPTSDQQSPIADHHFQNEPHTDFTIPNEREKMRAAIQQLRLRLGRRHALIINNKPVATRDWPGWGRHGTRRPPWPESDPMPGDGPPSRRHPRCRGGRPPRSWS